MSSNWLKPGLARPLVWSVTTNKIIAFLAMLALAAGVAYRYLIYDEGLLKALWIGSGAALTTFLTWALGRELDPGRPWSGILGGVFGLITWFYFANPDFLLLFATLMCLRMVNRSTGKPASFPEAALILFLTGWLTWSGSLGIAGVTGIAFWLDARLPGRKVSHYGFAFLALVTGVAASLVISRIDLFLEELQIYFLAVSILLTIPTIIYYQGQGVQNDEGKAMDKIRIMGAISVGWMFLAAGATAFPNVGLHASYPILGALLAAAIFNTVPAGKKVETRGETL